MSIKAIVEKSISEGDLTVLVDYSRTHLDQVIGAIEALIKSLASSAVTYPCMLAIAYCKKQYSVKFSESVEQFYYEFKRLMKATT